MSTTLTLAHKLTGRPVTLVVSGADPADPGPAGALIKMFGAMLCGDEELAAGVMTAASRELQRKPFAGERVVMTIEPARIDGDRAIVPATVDAEGQEMMMPFQIVRQDGAWLVDMHATLDAMMSGVMDQLTDAMKTTMTAMTQGMARAMDAIGDAMQSAGQTEEGEEKKKEDDEPGGDGDGEKLQP